MRKRLFVAYILFGALVLGFYWAIHDETVGEGWVDPSIIKPMTGILASLGAWFMKASGAQVWSAGTQVSSLEFTIDIHKGCDGVEALCILWAATIAYPWPLWSKLFTARKAGSGWLHALSPIWVRLVGIVAGAFVLQVANLARILSLFWIGSHWPWLFAQSHVLVWQSLIILVALVIWYFWVVKVADVWR